MVLAAFKMEKYSAKTLNTSDEVMTYSTDESAVVIKPFALTARLTRAVIVRISITAT